MSSPLSTHRHSLSRIMAQATRMVMGANAKLTLLLIPLILLSSCTIDWNDEKNAKIAELEKQVQDDLFKKKQECAKYTPAIESRIQKSEKELNIDGDYYHETLDEIVYSKNLKSCIAVGRSNWVMQPKNGGEAIKESMRVIFDVLSNDMRYYNMQNTDEMNLYANKIRELKGE